MAARLHSLLSKTKTSDIEWMRAKPKSASNFIWGEKYDNLMKDVKKKNQGKFAREWYIAEHLVRT